MIYSLFATFIKGELESLQRLLKPKPAKAFPSAPDVGGEEGFFVLPASFSFRLLFSWDVLIFAASWPMCESMEPPLHMMKKIEEEKIVFLVKHLAGPGARRYFDTE